MGAVCADNELARGEFLWSRLWFPDECIVADAGVGGRMMGVLTRKDNPYLVH